MVDKTNPVTEEQKALDRAAEEFVNANNLEGLKHPLWLGEMRKYFSAGHASRDAEVKSLREKLEMAVAAIKAPSHEINDYNCQDWPPGEGCRACTGDRLRNAFLASVEAVANEEGRDG